MLACAMRNGDPQSCSRNPSSWQAPGTYLLGRKLIIADWKGVLKICHVYMIVVFYLHSIHLSCSSAESLIYMYICITELGFLPPFISSGIYLSLVLKFLSLALDFVKIRHVSCVIPCEG